MHPVGEFKKTRYVITSAILIFVFVGANLNANQVLRVKTEVSPGKMMAPCPVTLEFKAHIMADEFGDIQYRWIRSDEAEMPVETLSLPESGRTKSGWVIMNWDVAPLNTPRGKDYWADVEIISPDSLGSMGRATAYIACEDAKRSSEKSSDSGSKSVPNTESPPNTENAADDLFDMGGENAEDVLVVGSTGQSTEPEPEPVPDTRPSLRPKEFACPVRTISVDMQQLPSGWERLGRRPTATAELKAHTVTPEALLVCFYQNGRWLLPLTRPVPDGYAECTRQDNFFFRCTG